jgi:hypothetical protein
LERSIKVMDTAKIISVAAKKLHFRSGKSFEFVKAF